MSGITINPNVSVNAPGTFGVQWDGLMQGTAWPDPAIRNSLSGGRLATTETLPMWGGVGIYADVPAPQGSPATTPDVMLGPKVGRATNVTGGSTAKNLCGFSVFDQNYSAINTPQSPVPLQSAGGNVNFYRLGSGARVAVKMDAALLSLGDDIETTPVSWEYDAQMLVQYEVAFPANALLAQSWASTGGGQVTFQTTTNHTVDVGGSFTISGSTPAAYNGTYVAITGTATDTLVAVKLVDPGSSTVLGTLKAGGGALPCRILRVQASNCMIVDYDSETGFATWDRDGAAAIILI